MARIQVMPLTPVTVGEYTSTPFILVFDQLSDIERIETYTPELLETIREASGAREVLATEETLDVGSPLNLTDEQRGDLLAKLVGREGVTELLTDGQTSAS